MEHASNRNLWHGKLNYLISRHKIEVNPFVASIDKPQSFKPNEEIQDIFTVHANLAGVPAISIPVAQHTNNMPFGIQLMANRFEEEKLLACASYMMNELH